MIRATALAMLVALPAQAQTPLEAAATNVQIAMSLCFGNYRQPEALHGLFTGAGFVHSTESYGPGEVVNWYGDPAGLVNVLILAEPGGAECRITTEQFGVEQALPYARAVMGTLYAGQIIDASPENDVVLPGTARAAQEECTGFHMLVPQRLIWVKLARAGNDGTCQSDGTATIRMLM